MIKNVLSWGKVPVKVWTDEIDHLSENQLINLSNMPFVYKHIAAMPDVHLGKGATVGSVFATKGAIIPAAVGVDIGCGMIAVRTSLKSCQLPDSLYQTRLDIESAIPLGAGAAHNGAMVSANHVLSQRIDPILQKHKKLAKSIAKNSKFYNQLGTLGSGNHFIELCIDENEDVWIMLHSGSRGPGNLIGQYFIELAKEDMRKHFINLPDKDLSYVVEGTENYDDYVSAVSTMQSWAYLNRDIMLDLVIKAMRKTLPEFTLTKEAINCHHNYISMENHFGTNVWVTRKGAIRARVGDLGIIPGSMGAKSYIVEGKGNDQSFHSCSHGAGRVHSRTMAKNLFTVSDLVDQTHGIECRKDEGVLDEIPGAYKDIDVVMENQKDLVGVVHTLKQVLNVKG